MAEGREAIEDLFEDGRRSFEAATDAKFPDRTIAPPAPGARELAAVVEGEPSDMPPEAETLDLIVRADPRYGSAWVLVDSRGYTDERGRLDPSLEPSPRPGGYEALLPDRGGPGGMYYWRAEFAGRLYLRRALADDVSPDKSRPEAGMALDPFIALEDAARCVGTSLALARALGFSAGGGTVEDGPREGARVLVAFRWTGLRGREIDPWYHQGLDVSPGRVAGADQSESLISVPLGTRDEDLVPFIQRSLSPLFGTFGWAPHPESAARVIEAALGPAP